MPLGQQLRVAREGNSSWTFLLHHGNALRASSWRYRVRGEPFSNTLPESGASDPAINFSSVDFPQALGPRIATISPARACKLVASSVNSGACAGFDEYA